MNTATELSRPGLSPTVPMPRIRAEPFASVPVEETSSDGASWLSWRMSLAPEFFISVGADCGDGDRHVLEDLAAALSGNDDVARLRSAAACAAGLTAACSVGDAGVAVVAGALSLCKCRRRKVE